MRFIKHIILLLFLFSGSNSLVGQVQTSGKVNQPTINRQQQQIAIQYYQNRNFEKSAEMFAEFYKQEPSHMNYTYYLYSLMELRNFKDAEKLTKKQVKKNAGQLKYQVDLGYVYINAGEPDKAKKQFKEVIKRLPPNIRNIKEIANAFYMRGQQDFAIETYQRGKILMEGTYTFDIELATMYERNGNYQEMVETYLNHLELVPEAREDVQNRLQTAMSRDIENILPEILRESLLVRYQENPEQVYLNELLLWLSIQQKDFSFALIQAKSLDRRFREDGYRVLQLAELAQANTDYEVAIESYQYLLDKGKDSPLYLNGLIGFLEARYQQVSNNIRIEEDEMLLLEAAYNEAIAEFGVHQQTMQLLRDLAHIQAFHLDRIESAIDNLNLAIEIPGPESLSRAKCKLELADIYLYKGEVWEATLLYSQVEKTYKNEPIGHEAKLKNARLTYYIGEFAWAKAQLDVLKAATSKLIANDALALSLLIADNIEIDSSYAGLRFYARAEMLLYMNKADEALITLDSIHELAAWHPLFDEVEYKKAEIYITQGKYEMADSLLAEIVINYPDDILGDDALFRRAQLQEEIFLDEEKAMELYQEILISYPGSVYTVGARKKFRALRGDGV